VENLIMVFEDRLKKWGAYLIGVPIFMMALIETLNAFGRKLWVPFPCAVETVESLLVITTYFGVSIVAIERGHVNVDLVTRKLPRPIRNYVTIFADVVGAAVFGLLTWGAWRMALYAVVIKEMRLGVYRFPLWPFKLLFALGLTLFVVQLFINIIKLTHVSLGQSHYANADKSQKAEIS
jgi:TRAP-type C4-dicarboxylate transport system permease small subunit